MCAHLCGNPGARRGEAVKTGGSHIVASGLGDVASKTVGEEDTSARGAAQRHNVDDLHSSQQV